MTAPSARPADAIASAGDRPALVPSEAATFPDTADERAVHDVVLAVGRAADAHDWPAVAAAFAPQVVLDYGTAEDLTPPAIVARWEPLLEAFDRTTHEVTDVQVAVTGDRATAASRFHATHVMAGAMGAGADAGDTWVLEGRYEHEFARGRDGRWRITRMRMLPGTSTGNTALPALAQARAASRAAARAASPAQGGLGAVRVERVTFTSGGQRVVGNLYLPAGLPAGGRLPAAVVGGAWMTIKEQMAGRYARELAARGIAALAFDYRGWGESAGAADGSVAEVRQREVPTHKIADLRAAVDFLARHPAVDPARLAGFGICASANYMAAVLAGEPRLTAAVFVAPWLQDPEVAAQVYGGADGMATLTALATETAAREQAAGRQEFVPAASLTDRTAVMFGAPYYTESDRGLIPAWRNQVDVAFWPGWLTVDGISAAARMRQPTLVVHSEAAGVPQGAHRFYTRLAGEKHELWLESVGQLDFYDREGPVRTASDAAAAHLGRVFGMPVRTATAAGRE